MKSIGTLSDMAGDRVSDPTTPMTENERLTALEKRVATLEVLLNDVMHQLDKPDTLPKAKANPSASTPKKKKPKTPKPKPKKQPPQPWDTPERLQEITALSDRILASEPREFTKAEVVSRFEVTPKLAGQALAWMVKTRKMSMHAPEPTPDDPDPKKIFSIKGVTDGKHK